MGLSECERRIVLAKDSLVSRIADRIRQLAAARNVVVSHHAAGRIRARGILLADILGGVAHGEVIEDYPDFHKGPALLMLQRDGGGGPLHVVWGIETGTTEPAVVVTAYCPEADQWTDDFRTRRP